MKAISLHIEYYMYHKIYTFWPWPKKFGPWEIFLKNLAHGQHFSHGHFFFLPMATKMAMGISKWILFKNMLRHY